MSVLYTQQVANAALTLAALMAVSFNAEAVIQKANPPSSKAPSDGNLRLDGDASIGGTAAEPVLENPFKQRTSVLGAARFKEGAEAYRSAHRSPDKNAAGYRDAMTAWREAAAENHPLAHSALAWMLLKGLGEPADVVEAETLAERAVYLGAPRASTLLSLVQAEAALDESALASLEQLAERGDGVALNELGVLSEGGRFQAPDVNAAKIFYRRAAAVGITAGRRNLQRLTSPVPAQAEIGKRRAELLAQSASKSGRRATYELALMAHRGDGMTPNYAEALRLYTQAAARGEPRAQAMLSLIFSRTLDGRLDPNWMRELALVSRYRPDLDVRASREPVRVDVMEEFILKGIKP